MIRLHNLTLSPDDSPDALTDKAAKLLGVSAREIARLQVVRRSVDARKRQSVRLVYAVDVCLKGNEDAALRRAAGVKAEAVTPYVYQIPAPSRQPDCRPVIVGFGPAGMFAALILAEAGLRPLVLERGLDAAARREKVARFWETGLLDPECNVQFGEGGAGTFSDGKLNTGISNPRIQWVLDQFVAAGADPSIAYDAKPHIGTDVLLRVVQSLRRRILALGGEVRFGARLTGLAADAGQLTGLVYEQNGRTVSLPCRQLILAVGHSARDTFRMLRDTGVPMAPKPFSMGVRIEHPQAMMDKRQYGPYAGHPALSAADYKLSCHLPGGRSVYSFCMCPGGFVVAAASQEGGVVTNGMSLFARDGENANSALLVGVTPADFPDSSVLSGVQWQEAIERQAFLLGGGSYCAPAQLAGDFLSGQASRRLGAVTPTYRPGVALGDLRRLLPPMITDSLAQALLAFDRKLPGFSLPDAVLTGPETRSSSPVRILRDESRQSPLRGLYPCGEGAGYAGGITSAAVDGIQCAEAILTSLR